MIVKDPVMRRWVLASVYLLSSGISFYGLVHGTWRNLTVIQIVLLLCVVVGLFLAALWQMLQGILASIDAQQTALAQRDVTAATKPTVIPRVPESQVVPPLPDRTLRHPPAPDVVVRLRNGGSDNG